MRSGSFCRGLAWAAWVSTWSHAALAQPASEPEATPAFHTPGLERSAGEVSFSIGARVDRGDTRSGVLGFAALNVPLERFVNAPRIEGAPDKSAAAADVPAPASEPAVAAPAAVAPLLSASELSLLAREAVAAAQRASGAPLQREQLERLASRARLSAALPELRVRGQRSDDESLRLTPSTEDPYRYSVAGGRDWLLEAQLTFRLSRLVFADEELALERLRIERERTSARSAAFVVERVLAWHHALTLSRDPELTPEARQRLELTALEAEVELDVHTGGWFGERTARHRAPAPRVEAPPASNTRTPSKPPEGPE
jgi:hypothetical protein